MTAGYLSAVSYAVLTFSKSCASSTLALASAIAAVIAAVYTVSGMTSAHVWAGFGAAMGRFLGTGWRLRAFNMSMAALMMLGVLALLTEDLGGV